MLRPKVILGFLPIALAQAFVSAPPHGDALDGTLASRQLLAKLL